MKILIIDNNVEPECWGTEDLRRYARLIPGAVIQVRRGPHDDLPESFRGQDKVILSGSLTSAMDRSPWVLRLHDLIRDGVEHSIPMLGVCYGHQSIAHALGGADHVGKAKVPEFGWSEIKKVAPSRIFDGLKDRFHSYSYHYDEVQKLPPGFKVTARSDLCDIQAFELEGKPVYGVQFHPETDLDEAQIIYRQKKKSGEARYYLNGENQAKVYDPKVSERIFRNFLES